MKLRSLPAAGLVFGFVAVTAAQSFKIAAIEATGLQRITLPQLITASGLSIGQTVTAADIDAAASRLVDGGLFDRAQYQVKTSAGNLTITFQVHEVLSAVPVVYDNFTALTDAELTAAIRQKLPGFDGTAPDGPAIESIVQALTGALRAKGLPGTVVHRPAEELGGAERRHVFRVSDPAPKVCAVNMTGTSPATDAAVRAVMQDLIANEWSRHFLERFLRLTATQPYRHLGYWNATFGQATVKVGGACAGVTLEIPVVEGDVYRWDHAEFIGNAGLNSAQLEALLGHKAGDVADGAKLEAFVVATKKAYRKTGHLAAAVSYEPVLDAASKRAVFRITSNEGPQFRMGTIQVTGVSPKDADAIAKSWKLKPGDVFDATYQDEFQLNLRRSLGASRLVKIDLSASGNAPVVNVSVSVR